MELGAGIWIIGAGLLASLGLLLWGMHLRGALKLAEYRRDELEQQRRLDEQSLRQLEQQQRTDQEEKRDLSLRLEQARQQLALAQQELAGLRHAEQQRLREQEQRIRDLEEARAALTDQRERIIEEQRQRRQQEQENRDRQWALHEQQTLSLLRELTSRNDLYFPFYDNTQLPEDFDQGLKPDSMIRFLDQYVIFDAKLSKSQNLQAYLASQAKQTAGKLAASAERDQIYPRVFFIVPSMAVGGLKTLSYYEQGYRFYCISPEALEPILQMFKCLEQYEFADMYNPQEREQIVHVLASLEHHIRHQNAVNVLSALRGIDSLEAADALDGELRQAVDDRRRDIRTQRFTPTSLKRLMNHDEQVRNEILRIVSPKPAAMEEEDLDELE